MLMNYFHDTSIVCESSLHDRIRIRAFEIYEARGRVPDHAMDDWLKAEAEIRRHLGLDYSELPGSVEEKIYPLMLLAPQEGEDVRPNPPLEAERGNRSKHKHPLSSA